MTDQFTVKNILILGGSRRTGATVVRRFASATAKAAFTYAGSEAIQADNADRETGAMATLQDDSYRRSGRAGSHTNEWVRIPGSLGYPSDVCTGLFAGERSKEPDHEWHE